MSRVPSIYNDSKPNALRTENAQIRFCVDRCGHCNALTTIQFLANDIPCFLRCFACNTERLYSEEDLKEMHLL